MKVILLQDVAKIGKKFDVKNVSDGYALNFLIPQKKAKIATAGNLKEIEILKSKKKDADVAERENLIQSIKHLKDSVISITAKTNDEGSLFAGIGKDEIIRAIKDQKALNIPAENIILEKPIKEAIEQKITIQLDDERADFIIKIIPENK